MGSWFDDNLHRKVGNGLDTHFWMDPSVDGVPISVWFPRLFKLTVDSSVTVAEMFNLGWGFLVRRGSGGGGCLHGRKSWFWSVAECYLMLFCRLTLLIGGNGS